MLTVAAVVAGFLLDALLGDPRRIPHPIVAMGNAIAWLEPRLRAAFPDTPSGARRAGVVLVAVLCAGSFGATWCLIAVAGLVHPLLGFAVETWLCYQALAACELRRQSMRVVRELTREGLPAARRAVGMIVGRDTERLDEPGVARAAVETVAENTSDGVIAPLFYLALGGAGLGFFYKAVNTMDSMLGYVEPPYKNIGLIPAKLDDVFNFIPARLSALFLLAAGVLLHLDVKNGWQMFKRDRYKHASPNSAQTESVCAGLLGLRLAGEAWYHGVLHKKDYIGDAKREIELEDIPRAGRLMYLTAVLALAVFGAGKALLIVL